MEGFGYCVAIDLKSMPLRTAIVIARMKATVSAFAIFFGSGKRYTLLKVLEILMDSSQSFVTFTIA
jgi:hypothetical protein